MTNKISDIKTFSDPAKIGIVEFKTNAAKVGLYKKMKGTVVEWETGETMWWTNNDTIEQRIKNKTLGQVKNKLIQAGHEIKTVRIDWAKSEVKIKGVWVAKVGEDGSMQTRNEADSIQKDVEAAMQEWKDKRNIY